MVSGGEIRGRRRGRRRRWRGRRRRRRSEAPLGEERGGDLPRVLESGDANLARIVLAHLLRSQLRDQSVDLLTHPLGLEVTHLLRTVHRHVLGDVLTLRSSRHVVTVVRSTGLEGYLLTDGVREGSDHLLVGGAALVLLALRDLLHQGGVPELGHTAGLVLGLTHLPHHVSRLSRTADSLPGIVTPLLGLLHRPLVELDVAVLPVVVGADLLRAGDVLGDVGEVALSVHLVSALLHRDLLNT